MTSDKIADILISIVLEQEYMEIENCQLIEYPDHPDTLLSDEKFPFLYILDGDDFVFEDVTDYPQAKVKDFTNEDELCNFDDDYDIVRCHHTVPCKLTPSGASGISLYPTNKANDPLSSFICFLNTAYPRVWIKALENDDPETIKRTLKERASLVESIHSAIFQYSKQVSDQQLLCRKALEFYKIFDCEKLGENWEEFNTLFPGRYKDKFEATIQERAAVVEEYRRSQIYSVKKRMKRNDAKELVMHQTYIQQMCLLMNKSWTVPSNMKFNLLVLTEYYCDDTVKEMELKQLKQLRELTDSFRLAFLLFRSTHRLLKQYREQDVELKEFIKEMEEF